MAEPDKAEKIWSLEAEELINCPFYAKGDSLEVQMPGVFGKQPQMCSMPVATFIPIALDTKNDSGFIEAGFKNCSCRWNYCGIKARANPVNAFDEVLSAENQMSKPFLEQMPANVTKAFRDRATPMRFSAGQIVLEPNVTSSHFHVIVKGLVRIANHGTDGRILELSVLRKGDCFGEMSILTGAPTSNQVDAVEECLTIAISRNEFHKLISEFPVLSVLLYRMLSKRIKANNQKLANLMTPGLSGDLQFFPFIELVQTIMTARMSGILLVDLLNQKSRFGFFEGSLIYGSLGKLLGTSALDEVLRWRNGSFRFHSDESPPEANIEGENMAILLDALRRMDESTMLERAAEQG